MCDADLEALLLLCGDFVLTQVSNADDQNVVFHLLRLPTMPVTLDDQRKRHKKAKEKTITPNTPQDSCSTQQCTMCILGSTMALWSNGYSRKNTFSWENNSFEAIFPILL